MLNINKLSPEQVNSLSEEIGSKVRDMVDNSVIQINSYLKSYNLKIKMVAVLDENKPKRGRPRKQS